MSYRNGIPTFYNIGNLSAELRRLETASSLSAKTLLSFAQILKQAQELKDYFQQEFLDLSEYPVLTELFSTLYTNQTVTDTIFRCIIDENTIDDSASKNLQSIRRQKRKLEQDIRNKLNDLIHSSAYAKYIQENIVTLRNDRFVIPVKEEYRNQIKGFVHDVSNAGSTVFIEPISVFDKNNELNRLKKEEEIEIEKILQELTRINSSLSRRIRTRYEHHWSLGFHFCKSQIIKINASYHSTYQ